MRRAVCPGSFDPITNGHLDVIERASWFFDEVVVVVGINVSKNRLFEPGERVEMIRRGNRASAQRLGRDLPRPHRRLLHRARIQAIVKGLRAVSDFDYEFSQMGQMNHSLAKVDTLFMPADPHYSFLSSSLVKEVATYGGDIAGLVPESVLQRLRERLAND